MGKSVEEHLERGETAFEDQDYRTALAAADAALALDPKSADALDLKAGALAELGRIDEAIEAFDALVALAPKDAAVLLAAADLKIRHAEDDRELLDAGLEQLDRAWPLAKKDDALKAEVQLLRGIAHNALGESSEALRELDQVLTLEPDHGEARLERGLALFELSRFAEARRAFEDLTRDYPDEAWAWHYLGLVAERQGQDPAPLFAKARALSPEEFPPPVHLAPDAFDRAVGEAIARLPAHARPHLANVVIDVQPLPPEDDLKEGVSPLVLGLFRGKAVDERSPLEAADHQTATITLFQKNLERFARTREELVEEIGVTVLHEVGHLLGLDEDELYERGLD